MKMLTKFIDWLSKKESTVKILFFITIIISLLLLIYGIYKLIPWIPIILLSLWLIHNKREEKIEITKANEALQIQNRNIQLQYSYIALAEQLFPVINEYKNELGIRISKLNSILYQKGYCIEKNGIWLFRYRVQVSKDSDFEIEDLRYLMQERLDQQLLDFPVWIAAIKRTSNHIMFLATFINCYEVEQYRNKYESVRYAMLHKDMAVNKDDKEF